MGLSNENLNVNPFKRWIIKKVIYLKNHLTVIPLLFTAISLIEATLTMFIFTQAINTLPYTPIDAFLYFIIIMCSVLSTVSYLMAIGKHVSKAKKISMLVIYYILMLAQIGLDIFYYQDVQYQIGLNNRFAEYWYITQSATWSIVHVILLGISIVLSIIAPIVQPHIKKIQLGIGRVEN